MDDVAAFVRVGAQLAHDLGIIAVGDEADVLAVGLQGYSQPQFGGDFAHLRLGQGAQGKAEIIKLRLGGGEEEIALVAGGIGGAV